MKQENYQNFEEEQEEDNPNFTNVTQGNTLKLKGGLISNFFNKNNNRETNSLSRNKVNYRMTSLSSLPYVSYSCQDINPNLCETKLEIQSMQFTMKSKLDKFENSIIENPEKEKSNLSKKFDRSFLSNDDFSCFSKSSPHKIPMNFSIKNPNSEISEFEPEKKLLSNEDNFKMNPIDEEKANQINSIKNRRRDFYFKDLDITGKTRESK